MTTDPLAALLEEHTPWARAEFARQRIWMACYCGWNANGGEDAGWNDHVAGVTAPAQPSVRESLERLGLPQTTGRIPPEIVHPAPFEDDAQPAPDPLRDEPVARLHRALDEHPNATYVRVEVIDLRAALEATP